MVRFLSCALISCCASAVLWGQEAKLKPSDVPAAVLATAKKRFSDAKLSGWSKEMDGGKVTYEASVTDSKGKRDAVFAEDGALMAVEEKIAVSEVPAPVKQAITEKYSSATIKAAEKISHEGGDVDYELDLTKAAKKEVTVSSAGKILKEE